MTVQLFVMSRECLECCA